MVHQLVRPLGQSPDGETWTFGMRFSLGAGGSVTMTTAELQAVADGCAALNSNKFLNDYLLSMISAALHVTGVRVEQIGADGKLQSAAETLYGTPVAGSGTATRTIQTAVVATLNRGAQYGRHGRGRIYIPSLASPAQNGTSLRILGTGNNDVATAVNQLQLAIRGVFDDVDPGSAGFVPVVYSPTLNTTTRIENISVGDVFDTQRRRRDRWVEARASQDVTN